MQPEKVYAMRLAAVYPLLVAKAVRKGRTQEEVDAVISWLTGYAPQDVRTLAASDVTYGAFFRDAPHPNPNRELIRGTVCGVRVEQIEDPLMREIRRLDKLVDELAKGRPMSAVLRSAPDEP